MIVIRTYSREMGEKEKGSSSCIVEAWRLGGEEQVNMRSLCSYLKQWFLSSPGLLPRAMSGYLVPQQPESVLLSVT